MGRVDTGHLSGRPTRLAVKQGPISGGIVRQPGNLYFGLTVSKTLMSKQGQVEVNFHLPLLQAGVRFTALL
jgi:hypothetical protein